MLHQLLLSDQSLRCAISHHPIIIIKYGIHGEGPGVIPGNAEHILERDGLLIALAHGVGGLLLQTVDRSDARHDAVGYIHQHRRGEEEGADAEDRHDPHEVDDEDVEGAVLIGAEEVVEAKDAEGIGRASPRVDEEEDKVLEIGSTNAVIHPGAVMVHSADAAVADSAVMAHGGFEGLALAAHGVGGGVSPLSFLRYGTAGDRTRIGQRGFGVT
mmetsp:Transcript_6704/g.18726  ORF Transcript_6704/g.18726 Transcript_6704/m.18726 type:complete len:214 (+) Transcript_6704:253-894(+)